MRHGCCLVSALALATSLFLSGCQSPTDPITGLPEREFGKPAEPKVSRKIPEGVTGDEAVRLQYRQMRAKELVEEAKILRIQHRFAEASDKMAEANKLLEGLPEE